MTVFKMPKKPLLLLLLPLVMALPILFQVVGCGPAYRCEHMDYMPGASGGGIINDSMALFNIKVTEYCAGGGGLGMGGG